MKLKTFLDFVATHGVTQVLHTDPSKSGTIKDIDYDDKVVTIEKQGGGNSRLKLNTLLSEYQLLCSNKHVRLGKIHNFKYDQEVLYIKSGSSYSGTEGRVTHVNGKKVTVEWSHGESYEFGNDDSLKDILFVKVEFARVKTQEEINMEAYAAKMKKIAEDVKKPEYFLFYKINGVPVKILCVINASNAEEAKSMIPPIFQYIDTILLLKVGGQ